MFCFPLLQRFVVAAFGFDDFVCVWLSLCQSCISLTLNGHRKRAFIILHSNKCFELFDITKEEQFPS
ncbi:hypothetical protein EMIT0194P_20531 [Pseudomonas serbica]